MNTFEDAMTLIAYCKVFSVQLIGPMGPGFATE